LSVDNIIARHKGRDNTILFAMDEVEWRRIKGLPYLHYRQQFVEYWDEVYVKPGHYQRDDGHWLSQSHDNIFAWFRAFKVFNIADLSTKLIRELDMVGWQLFELDGKTQKKEGIMPPFLEIFCRVVHTGNISSLSAIYLALHMIHSKFKTTWNLEFHRHIAIQEIESETWPAKITKTLSLAFYGNADWEKHALHYHADTTISAIIRGESWKL